MIYKCAVTILCITLSSCAFFNSQPKGRLALEILVDKSRSMFYDDKLKIAKSAMLSVSPQLSDDDFFGVIGFDATMFEVLRLAPLSQNRSLIADRVSRLFPMAQTNLFPAMDLAKQRLQAVNAKFKAVVIITDGKIADEDVSYFELTKAMHASQISVSVFVLGKDSDFFKKLGVLGTGSYAALIPSDLSLALQNEVARLEAQ